MLMKMIILLIAEKEGGESHWPIPQGSPASTGRHDSRVDLKKPSKKVPGSSEMRRKGGQEASQEALFVQCGDDPLNGDL